MNITLKSIAGFYSSKDGDINSKAKKKKKSQFISLITTPPKKKVSKSALLHFVSG